MNVYHTLMYICIFLVVWWETKIVKEFLFSHSSPKGLGEFFVYKIV